MQHTSSRVPFSRLIRLYPHCILYQFHKNKLRKLRVAEENWHDKNALKQTIVGNNPNAPFISPQKYAINLSTWDHAPNALRNTVLIVEHAKSNAGIVLYYNWYYICTAAATTISMFVLSVN